MLGYIDLAGAKSSHPPFPSPLGAEDVDNRRRWANTQKKWNAVNATCVLDTVLLHVCVQSHVQWKLAVSEPPHLRSKPMPTGPFKLRTSSRCGVDGASHARGVQGYSYSVRTRARENLVELVAWHCITP